MKATPTGTKEHPYVLRINRSGRVGHYTALSIGLNEIVVETGAEHVSVKHTFTGKPYLSLHGSAAEKTSLAMWYPIYKVPATENSFWNQGKALAGLLAEELEISDDTKIADVTLVPMGSTDTDSLMDLEFREWFAVEEDKEAAPGNDNGCATASKDEVQNAVAIVEDSVTTAEKGAVGEHSAASQTIKLPEQEPVVEDTPDAPGSDIWMKLLYCDNGYVVRDDAGVMMVLHSDGSSNKAIGKHIGMEIMGEIDDLETHAQTEKPIFGWEVNVSVRAITKPEEFFS